MINGNDSYQVVKNKPETVNTTFHENILWKTTM